MSLADATRAAQPRSAASSESFRMRLQLFCSPCPDSEFRHPSACKVRSNSARRGPWQTAPSSAAHPSRFPPGDQQGVAAVFFGTFLNGLDQIDDLRPVAAFLLLNQLYSVGVDLHKIGDVLQLVNPDMFLYQFVCLFLEGFVD